MKTFKYPERSTWKELCRRPELELEFLESAVKNILHRVKVSGDSALREITAQLDKAQLSSLSVSSEEFSRAEDALSPKLKSAIRSAAANIEKFHASQRRPIDKIETTPGVVCWRKPVGIDKVGIYIPGGSAPLFSTVLMLGIPARIAGCGEVILCTPPDSSGRIHDAILFAAKLTGITKVFKAGGAQAIAALAYGTESIPAVSKIFGPGNQYVTKAKQMVNLEGTAIDMPAGPSEVLVVADKQANPSFIAADLLSQAEHGADSQVVLATDDESILAGVDAAIQRQLETLPRKAIAAQALQQSLAVLLRSKEEIIDFVNAYAPEHLIINTSDYNSLAEQIINAGSVFLGPYSPESAGDYASGTNHTLPTNGYARAYGGVSLESFTKYITFQELSKQGILELGPVVEQMASAEMLEGHGASIRVRLNELK